MKKRIVNINFRCEGLDFDAAIDCDNVLKETLQEEYLPEEISEYRTNIELYCSDRPWGHRFIHYEGDPDVVVNDKESDRFGHYHTVCDMNEIMTAAREWIKEKEEEEDAEFSDKPWYTACCKDCKFRRLIIEGKRAYCLMLYVAGNESTNCGLVKKWMETRK